METVIKSEEFGFAWFVDWDFKFHEGYAPTMHDPGMPDEYEIEVHGIWQANENDEATGHVLSWNEWQDQEAFYLKLEEEAERILTEREVERQIEAYEDRKYSI